MAVSKCATKNSPDKSTHKEFDHVQKVYYHVLSTSVKCAVIDVQVNVQANCLGSLLIASKFDKRPSGAPNKSI